MYRDQIHAVDRAHVFHLLSHCGQFKPHEIAYVMTLFDSALHKEAGDRYHFVLQEKEQQIHGFGCYGALPLAEHRFQIYWLAVDMEHRKTGLGKLLEQALIERIRKAGGTQVFVEASSQERHQAMRHFYEGCGYSLAAVVPNFYGTNDHKVWLSKQIG